MTCRHRQPPHKPAACLAPGGALRFGQRPNPARRGQRPAVPERVWRLALSLLLSGAAAQAALEPTQPVAEYQLKAAVLVNLAKFVEWPANAFAGPGAPLVIGVVGQDPFGGWLDQATAGQTVAGHPVQVQRLSPTSPLTQAQVLFVSRSEQARLPKVLEAVRGEPRLTVSDAPGFAAQGGMIGLVLREATVRFEVNLPVLQAAGLRLSSKVLKYATLVGPGSEPPPQP